MESGRADKIQEVIDGEKEEAGQNFDSQRFETALFKRIRDAKERSSAPAPVFLRKPWLAAAFSAILLAVAGSLIFRAWPRSQPQPAAQAIGAVLALSGDGRRDAQDNRPARGIDGPEYTELGWALKGVLYAYKRQALGEVSLTGALSGALRSGPGPGGPGENVSQPKYPRTGSLRLRTGEEFRMFFARFLKSLEEV